MDQGVRQSDRLAAECAEKRHPRLRNKAINAADHQPAWTNVRKAERWEQIVVLLPHSLNPIHYASKTRAAKCLLVFFHMQTHKQTNV